MSLDLFQSEDGFPLKGEKKDNQGGAGAKQSEENSKQHQAG